MVRDNPGVLGSRARSPRTSTVSPRLGARGCGAITMIIRVPTLVSGNRRVSSPPRHFNLLSGLKSVLQSKFIFSGPLKVGYFSGQTGGTLFTKQKLKCFC